MPWTCSGPTYAGGYAWSTTSGAVYAQDARDGHIAWIERGPNSCVPPTIANGILYTMSNNTLRMRALASGNLLRLPAERRP
jgi:outer membrane protein assembly factor BamB